MSKYFAEIQNNTVQRVISAENKQWCTDTFGGEWVETFIDDPVKKYAGKGDKYNYQNDDFEPSYILTEDMKKQFVSGNVFIRKNMIPNKGGIVKGHKHNFDHTTIFLTGSFHVTETNIDGVITRQTFTSPAETLILKDSIHEIKALEDNSSFWCVFSHRNENGEVTQEAGDSYIPYI